MGDLLADAGAIAGCLVTVGFEMLGYAVNNFKDAVVKPKPCEHRTSLHDQVCIITGGNAGIGFATAQLLAERGATLILACRDVERASKAAQDLRSVTPLEQCPAPTVEVMQVDLSCLDSVRAFCTKFNDSQRPLHMLVCNAGLMAPLQRLESRHGLEMQFQVNHLSHWLMAHELLACQRDRRLQLQRSRGVPLSQLPATRVVFCSSATHTACCNGAERPDWNSEKRYIPLKAYAYSKLANILSAWELQRRCDRHPEYGRDVVVALHPGVVRTELANGFFAGHGSVWAPQAIKAGVEQGVVAAMSLFMMTAAQAACNVLHAAVAPAGEVAGKYLHGSHVARPHKAAEDPALAAALWGKSCELARVVTHLSLS